MPGVAVYTWNFHPDLIDSAIRKGASGYLSKTLPARDLVTALESIHGGATVINPMPGKSRAAPGLDWPGRSEGLTERESEILALITQGKSNAEVAVTTYLSVNSIKSYIRSVYRKIGVKTRTQAVLWGVEHGFKPDHDRLDLWRGDTWRACRRRVYRNLNHARGCLVGPRHASRSCRHPNRLVVCRFRGSCY